MKKKITIDNAEIIVDGNKVTGDTFYCRKVLKRWGGTWNPETKTWTISISAMNAWFDKKPWMKDKIEIIEDEPKQKNESNAVQGLRNLISDGSLPSEEEILEQILNETSRADAIPYGRN